MRISRAWILTVGVSAAACGGGSDTDASNNSVEDSDMDADQASSSGCKSGRYPGGEGTLTLCGPAVPDDPCVPLEKFRGYTSYAGDIDIFPGTASDLSALSCLREAGRLVIGQSEELVDLRGLENVTKASAVELLGNEKLTSLRGLDKLTSLVQITVNDNDGLTDIVGLPKGLTLGSLWIGINSNLTSLSGLEGISVTRKITIEENEMLSSCVVDDFLAMFPSVEGRNLDNLEAICP